VTLAAGVIASVIGIFPGLSSKFLDFAALYGLALCLWRNIFVDHYFMRRTGMLDFYADVQVCLPGGHPLQHGSCPHRLRDFEYRIWCTDILSWTARLDHGRDFYAVMSKSAQNRLLIKRLSL